jgi:hypothetical protein
MNNIVNHEVSIEDEIKEVFVGKPHVILLGSGASIAALPDGDKSGKPAPALNQVATKLDISKLFPEDLVDLSKKDFESAYSKLFNRNNSDEIERINRAVSGFFSSLELSEEVNLYDKILLSLREKDVVATFNWDPLLLQSRVRLAKLGVQNSPNYFFFMET